MSVVNGMVNGMRRGSATGTPKARSGAKSRQEGAPNNQRTTLELYPDPLVT